MPFSRLRVLSSYVGLAMLLVMLPRSNGFDPDVLDDLDCSTVPISQSNVSDCDLAGHCSATVTASVSFDFLSGAVCLSLVPTNDDASTVRLYVIPSSTRVARLVDSSYLTDDPQCHVAGYKIDIFNDIDAPARPTPCHDCPFHVLDDFNIRKVGDTFGKCVSEDIFPLEAEYKYMRCEILDRYYVGHLSPSYQFSSEVEFVVERDGNRTSMGTIVVTTNGVFNNVSDIISSFTNLAFQFAQGYDFMIVDRLKADSFYILPGDNINGIDSSDRNRFGWLKNIQGEYRPTSFSDHDYHFDFVGTDPCKYVSVKGNLDFFSSSTFLDGQSRYKSGTVLPGSSVLNATGSIQSLFAHSVVSPAASGQASFVILSNDLQYWGCSPITTADGPSCTVYPDFESPTQTYYGPAQSNKAYYENASVSLQHYPFPVKVFSPNTPFEELEDSWLIIGKISTVDDEFVHCWATALNYPWNITSCDQVFFVAREFPSLEWKTFGLLGSGSVVGFDSALGSHYDPEGIEYPPTTASSILEISLHGFEIHFDSSSPNPKIRSASIIDKGTTLSVSAYSLRQTGVCILQTVPIGMISSSEITLSPSVGDYTAPLLYDHYKGVMEVEILCKEHSDSVNITVSFDNREHPDEQTNKSDTGSVGAGSCGIFSIACREEGKDCGWQGFECFLDDFLWKNFFHMRWHNLSEIVASVIKCALILLASILVLYLLLKLALSSPMWVPVVLKYTWKIITFPFKLCMKSSNEVEMDDYSKYLKKTK